MVDSLASPSAATAAAVVDARTATRARQVRWAAAAITLAALVVALVRLPGAVSSFDERATFNAHQSSIGRTIAASDALEISNDFLVHALALVPTNAAFALLQPPNGKAAAVYGISPTTLAALHPYVEYLMLPRRLVTPDKAQYLLCYACNTDPYDSRMQRLWVDPDGFVIGKLER